MIKILKHTGIQCSFCYPQKHAGFEDTSKVINNTGYLGNPNSSGKPNFIRDNKGSSSTNLNPIIYRSCNGKGHYASQFPTNTQQKPGVCFIQDYEGDENDSDVQNEEILGKEKAE